ncbi:cell wall protein [Pyxidicoccus parkwayensis]|uniref:Cell wall protein n=1 Tax=Pyxidicoccus parkwayensis TaxID=2813578 RepID=A0ABX7PCV2_9BACT|nr:cell wall protein [Pyxidicoccus parkwaysis]
MEAAAPAPRACAVIGCKRPHRSQGYCATHYQKRRLMLATGRLHAEWVENAAPHSIPDVILPRGRRPKAESSRPPAPVPAPAPTPKVWVRKKQQGVLPLGPDLESATVAPRARPASPSPAGTRPAQGSEHEAAIAAAQRWASDFLAQKRRS